MIDLHYKEQTMIHAELAKRLTAKHDDFHSLQQYAPDWLQAVKSAYTASGELRAAVEAVFPQEAGIYLLQASLPRRQVWWAVLSGLDMANTMDLHTLRLNLLLLSDSTLLDARFGEKGATLKPILHALSPTPLAKAQYEVLAALLDEEEETLRSWIAKDGMLDAYKLREYLFADVATMNAVLADEMANQS